MTSDRKKTSTAFWTTVVLAVVLLYALSFGPACWFNERTGRAVFQGYGFAGTGDDFIFALYRPFFECAAPYPRSIGSQLIHWYAEVGTRDATLSVWYSAHDDGSPSRPSAIGWNRPADDYGR
jgi:hypothetical protein